MKRRQKSQVLVSVLILMTIVLVLSTALLFHSRSVRQISLLQSKADKAYSLAKTGIGIAKYLNAQAGAGGCGGGGKTGDYGPFNVSQTEQETEQIIISMTSTQITSTGKILYNQSSGGGVKNARVLTEPVLGGANTTWAKKYWSTTLGDDIVGWLVLPDDSGYILTGETQGILRQQVATVVMKTDCYGNVKWADSIEGAKNKTRTYKALCKASDGGYLAGMYTTAYGNATQMLLTKLDANGNLTWAKLYGDSKIEDPDWIIETTANHSSGYLIAADSTGYGSAGSKYDYLLLKINNTGTKEWDRLIGGSGDDYPYAAQQRSDGGYIITGTTKSWGTANFMLINTNDQGQVGASYPGTWIQYYNITSTNEEPRYVEQAVDGGWIMEGTINETGSTKYDILVIKTNATGCINNTTIPGTWAKKYSNSGVDERGEFFQKTTDGGYLISGTTNAPGNWDPFLIKLDANGNINWSKAYDINSKNEYLYTAWATNEGGAILCGYSGSHGGLNQLQYFLFKVNPTGEIGNCSIARNITFTVTPLNVTNTTPASFNFNNTPGVTVSSVSPYVNGSAMEVTTVCQ